MGKPSWPLIAVVLLFAVFVAGTAGGVAQESSANKPQKPAKETPKAPVTADMEAEAMKFVSQHHPKLVELLNQLKTTN